MYFELEPKSRREDLYNFEAPFEKLMSCLKKPRAQNPLIVVKGIRRAGKTSLIKTTLNELRLPHLYVDGKKFAGMPVMTRRDLLKEFERGLSDALEKEKKWSKGFLEVLRWIEWLKVDSEPPFIHFEWRRKPREMDILDLIHSFGRLARQNKTRFVLVLDEAQELKRLADYKLQNLMSHIYDHMTEIQMIVSGSQVGLLDDFLEVSDPEAPLFGRGMVEVAVPKLSNDQAVDFLVKGCEQVGIKRDEKAIRAAVNELDGVIGWLTFFGYELMERGQIKDALVRTIEKGSRLEAQELEHFLKTREQGRRRYMVILKAAARLGRARWIDLKTNVETTERKRITDERFSNLLENLVKADFLNKEGNEYFVPDPLLVRAMQSNLVR